MADGVSIEIDKHVALVTLCRAQKHNALDLQMFADLIAAGVSLAGNASVRAVVLTGAGESFCAGIDLTLLQDVNNDFSARMAPMDGSAANFFQRAACIWRELPQPVICALHGNVFGAGLQIALGADLRYAAASCRLAIMEIRWGIVPDMGFSKTIPAGVRVDRVRELAMSGRIFSGSEAYDMGLVTELHDAPLPAAMNIAKVFAERSPDAIRALKVLCKESPQLSYAAALQLEARLQMRLFAGTNQAEAVRANLENRQPDFKDPG